MGTGGQFPVPRRAAYHDAAGVEVIVQRMALPQKLRAEKDMQVVEFFRTDAVYPTGTVDLMTMVASGAYCPASVSTASTLEVSK